MDRFALVVALAGVGLGGYAAYSANARWGNTARGSDDGTLRAEVESLRGEVRSLEHALAQLDGTSRSATTLAEPGAPRLAVQSRDDAPGTVVEAGAAVLETPPSSNDALLARFEGLEVGAKEDALGKLAKLAAAGDRRALDLIVETLSDPDPGLREEAIEALAEIADPALFSHIEAHSNDPSPGVREEVAEAMANMPAEKAGPVLTALLRDQSSEVIKEAIKSIGKLGFKEAHASVLAYARSDNFELATRAGVTLRKLGDEAGAASALEHVAAALSSSDPLDRFNAVKRIEKIGGKAAVPYLEQLVLSETSLSVREAAQEALAELDG